MLPSNHCTSHPSSSHWCQKCLENLAMCCIITFQSMINHILKVIPCDYTTFLLYLFQVQIAQINKYHSVTTDYSIQYVIMLNRFVGQEQQATPQSLVVQQLCHLGLSKYTMIVTQRKNCLMEHSPAIEQHLTVLQESCFQNVTF